MKKKQKQKKSEKIIFVIKQAFDCICKILQILRIAQLLHLLP
jgi:hypothetical protein